MGLDTTYKFEHPKYPFINGESLPYKLYNIANPADKSDKI